MPLSEFAGYRFSPGAKVSQEEWDRIFGSKEKRWNRSVEMKDGAIRAVPLHLKAAGEHLLFKEFGPAKSHLKLAADAYSLVFPRKQRSLAEAMPSEYGTKVIESFKPKAGHFAVKPTRSIDECSTFEHCIDLAQDMVKLKERGAGTYDEIVEVIDKALLIFKNQIEIK